MDSAEDSIELFFGKLSGRESFQKDSIMWKGDD
jgi:hypothetical protein